MTENDVLEERNITLQGQAPSEARASFGVPIREMRPELAASLAAVYALRVAKRVIPPKKLASRHAYADSVDNIVRLFCQIPDRSEGFSLHRFQSALKSVDAQTQRQKRASRALNNAISGFHKAWSSRREIPSGGKDAWYYSDQAISDARQALDPDSSRLVFDEIIERATNSSYSWSTTADTDGDLTSRRDRVRNLVGRFREFADLFATHESADQDKDVLETDRTAGTMTKQQRERLLQETRKMLDSIQPNIHSQDEENYSKDMIDKAERDVLAMNRQALNDVSGDLSPAAEAARQRTVHAVAEMLRETRMKS